jgi:hypothetical protein
MNKGLQILIQMETTSSRNNKAHFHFPLTVVCTYLEGFLKNYIRFQIQNMKIH